MRRTIDEIRQGKYSEDVEKEKRRRMEQLAEQNRNIIQEARESGREQSGPTRPPIRPVERKPPTVPEFSQAVRNTVLGRSTGYNPNQIQQVAAFNASVMAANDDISRKKKEQETLTKNRPSMEQELEALQKKEMEWYRSEHEKGNAFGMEGYDRYVSAIDPDASTEHGKAKKRIDELTRLLTLEANPQGTEREEDSATMFQDMAEIAKMTPAQRSALRQYAIAHQGVWLDGDDEYAAEWRDWSQKDRDTRHADAKDLLEKIGESRASKLAESYVRYINQSKTQKIRESAASSVSRGFGSAVGANIGSIPANIVGGVTGAGNAILESVRRLFGGSQYNTMDPNLPGYAPSQWAGTVRGETQRGIQESVPGFGGKALGSLYSAGMSAADNIARVALTGGTGSLALAGLGSFQSGVQEASEQGASPVRAVAMGVASGALEVLTEKVSLDQLLNTRSPESFRELLKNAAIQGGVEVSEEELSFAGNLLAEAVLLQENSKSNQAFHQYLENGMTADEAKRAVLNDNVLEAASTAVTSFLSGGMMSIGAGAKHTIQEKKAERLRNSTEKTSQEQTAQEQQPQTGPFQNGNNQEEQSGIPQDVVNEAMQRTFRGESVDKTDTRAYPSEAFSQSEPVDKSDFGGYNSVVNRQDAVVGAEGRTYAEDNREIRYRWAVVPAEALVTSHDEFGSFNQAYPSDLQPRDRTRAASQLQISRIAKRLNPALLAESPTAQNGAPIVRGDGVVIGGNARVQAISAAYKSGSADGYAQYIRQHAQEFGLNPQDLPGNPVLVRIPTGDADWSGMAASLNNSTTSSYSASETAQNDAKNMGEVISLLNVDESGNLNAKGNREFISAFVEKVIPQADRSRVVTASGSLSQEGLARVQNAVFSYAYGDGDLLTRLTESLDNDARNVTNALLAVAPQVARAKEAGRSGAQYDLGLSDAVTGAVRLYMEARDQGVTPVSLADQATMGDGYSSAEVAIARFLQENKRSGAQIKSFLSHLFDELEAQGSPDQESMFSGEPTIQSVVEGGMSRYESETGRSAGEFDRSYDERRGHESPAANGRKLQGRENPPQQSGSGRVQAVHGGPIRSGLGEVTSKGSADGSTGAAPKGFDVYNSLQYDTGNKPDRPNDARPVNVPKRDTKGQRVSDFVANAYGAKVTPDSFIPVIEKMVTDGLVGADTKTNRQSLEQAATEISSVGDAVMLDRISRSAESGSINESEIAAAQLLFAKYANSNADGSQDTAAKLLVDMTDMARAAGRALQLHKMMRQLTPEGQVAAVTENINRYYQKKFSQKIKSGKLPESVQIPESLRQSYMQSLSASQSGEIAAAHAAATEISNRLELDAAAAADKAVKKVLDMPRGEKQNNSSPTAYKRDESATYDTERAEKTGKKVADALARKAEQKQLSMEELLYREIMKFAKDKAGPSMENRRKITNMDALRDYYRYAQYFQTAWDAARARAIENLEKMSGEDPQRGRLLEFLRDHNVHPVSALDYGNAASTVRKAAKEAATKAGIRMDNKTAHKSAAKKMRDVLTENYRNKIAAANEIAEIAVAEAGLTGNEAKSMAADIITSFYGDLAERSARRVAEMFAPKESSVKVQKTLSQKLEELYNLGAFDEYGSYRQAAMEAVFGKDSGIDIPNEKIQRFAEGAEAERSAALGAIYEHAASQMPGTLGEKFDHLRYLSMLGNPKTHIRNIVGNEVFGRFVDVKRAVGAALEMALPQEQRTKAVIGFGKDSRALLSWARDDAKTADVKELLSPSGTTGDKAKAEIEKYRKIFKLNAMNKLVDGNSATLEAEDMLFKRRSYASSLAGFLKARGYSVQDVQSGNIDTSVLNEGRAYAVREAMRATFNDINAFSEAASKFGRRDSKSAPLNAVKKVFFEGVLPFRKTPANIVVRGVEYSPAGIVRACYQYFTKVRTGEMTAAECMDTLAAGLTGTGVYALGALLSSLGVISGGSISDDEDRTGRQAYALNIGDTSITLDWLAPAAIPFFMGVETQKFMEKDYDDGMSAVTAVLYGLGSAAEPLLELSCLSSLNDIITSARYADDGKVVISALTNAAVSYFTQVLPTAFGQFDQAADKNRKMVYTTASDPVMKELQRIAGRAFQKLPGDFFQTEYVDEWGRTEDKGNLFQRVFNAFLNPAYTSKINETPADKELARLEEATGESQSPKSASRTINVPTEDGSEMVRLSASQWDALARKQGSTSYDLVSAMLDQEAYQGLSDDGKRKAIESAYEYARELGKMEALPDRYTTPNTAWMVNLDGDTGEKAVAAILKRATISDVAATSEAVYDRAVEAGFSNSQMKAVFSGVSDRIKDIDQPTDYDKYRAVIDVCGKESEKWLAVYGMTDNQLAEMKKLSTTPRQYVDALDANSRLSKAMKSVTDAWKNGETPDPSKLDEAYDFFSSLSGARAAADPQFSSAISAYVGFRKALESSERFLVYYKKYRDISNKEGLTASERATEWAQYLDSSLLRAQAKSALLDNLSFYQTLKQDSGKYGELTDAGLHAKQAKAVSDLMKGLTPAPGKETVSTAQKIEAIHSIGMNRDQEEKALRVYLSESMEKNFDKAMGYGISAGEWVELYLEYTNQKGTGKGQKNRLTQWCMQELGVDYATARALADIYL